MAGNLRGPGSDVLQWTTDFVDDPWLREVVESEVCGTQYPPMHFTATGLAMRLVRLSRDDVRLFTQVITNNAPLPSDGPVRLFLECARWPHTQQIGDPRPLQRWLYSMIQDRFDDDIDSLYACGEEEHLPMRISSLCRHRLALDATLAQISRLITLPTWYDDLLRSQDRRAILALAAIAEVEMHDEMLERASVHHTAWWTKPTAPIFWNPQDVDSWTWLPSAASD